LPSLTGDPMADAGWYYVTDGQRQGPVGFERLRQLAMTGQVSPGDLVWCEGMADWQPSATVAGLAPPRPEYGGGPPHYAGGQPAPMYGGYAPPTMQYHSAGPIGPSQQGLAIAGFVLSFMIPLLGLIFSWVALSGMKRTGNEEGKGLATAGLIISIVIMGLGCLWVIGFVSCFGAATQGFRF
jgi:hypothetical protein